MNLDRFAMNAGRFSSSPKYIQGQHGEIYASALTFLDDVYRPEGVCYKDVTQPFVVASWLKQHPSERVLKIRPNVPHVAYAMINRRWLYPTVASRQVGTEAAMMIEGLLMAEAALHEVPGEEITFDDLLQGPAGLDAVLAHLAGEGGIAPSTLPDDFERRRDEVLARRKTDAFRQLAALETEIRESWSRRGAAARMGQHHLAA